MQRRKNLDQSLMQFAYFAETKKTAARSEYDYKRASSITMAEDIYYSRVKPDFSVSLILLLISCVKLWKVSNRQHLFLQSFFERCPT